MSDQIQALLTAAHKIFPIAGKGHHNITLNGDGKPVINLLIEARNMWYWCELTDFNFSPDAIEAELNDVKEEISKLAQ